MAGEKFNYQDIGALHDFLFVFHVEPEKMTIENHVRLQSYVKGVLQGNDSDGDQEASEVTQRLQRKEEESNHEWFHRVRRNVCNILLPLMLKKTFTPAEEQTIQAVVKIVNEANRSFISFMERNEKTAEPAQVAEQAAMEVPVS